MRYRAQTIGPVPPCWAISRLPAGPSILHVSRSGIAFDSENGNSYEGLHHHTVQEDWNRILYMQFFIIFMNQNNWCLLLVKGSSWTRITGVCLLLVKGSSARNCTLFYHVKALFKPFVCFYFLVRTLGSHLCCSFSVVGILFFILTKNKQT